MILKVIIDDFIQFAQPIGSRNLAKKDQISFSPATIRNEMSDLEELGFIEKTHTSSGRVPSEKGYRYYVDHLMSAQKLEENEVQTIRSIFAERIYEVEKIVQRSAGILSDLTNYTTIILGPAVLENRVKKLQIVPINRDTAIAIIVTNTGHVENRMVQLPESMNPSDIEKMVNILNERLIGVPLSELNQTIYKEVAMLLSQHIKNYDQVLNTIVHAMDLPSHERMFFGGKTKMLSQPEFRDIHKIRSLMDMIDQEEGIYDLIRHVPSGLNVKIGKENENSAMEDLSLITTTFSTGQSQLGSIAIIGPTRMEYSRVISLLELISQDMSKILTSIYNLKE